MTSQPVKLPPPAARISRAGPSLPAAALPRGTALPRGAGRIWAQASETARAYVELTKPGIVWLLLVTTVPAMIMASEGWPPLGLIALTMLGGVLTAGGANTLNHWFDRDLDALMARTAKRPLPQGRVAPAQALAWGLALAALGGVQLAFTVNSLAAVWALVAVGFYVLVYTMWLKRWTAQNIVIGGAAGAVPPLVGWAAVRGSVDVAPLLLFLIVFLWTPPHFWALALRYKDDYARANIPMLPVSRGERETKKQILVYSVLLLAGSLLLPILGEAGMLYLAAAAVLGTAFVVQALRLWLGRIQPMALFFASIIYLPLLFLAAAADELLL